jgi:hypothetical protein
MKTYGGVDVQIQVLLTWALVGSGQLHAVAALSPGKELPVLIGYEAGYPRIGLDDVERRKMFLLPGLELRPLGRRARSQSLSRLPYVS